MKSTNKLLVVFLAVAIVLSSIAVTTLTTSAAEMVAGINSTVYYVPGYLEIIKGGQGETASFEDNTHFDDTIEDLLATSYLIEESAATSISIHPDTDPYKNWFIQKWTGTMTPKASGEVTLIGRKIDNGFVMIVNDVKVYEYWGNHYFDDAEHRLAYDTSFTVEAGQEYEVEIYYMEQDGGNALEIYATTTPDDLNSGAPINDVADFDLTMQRYVIGDNVGKFNELVGIGQQDGDGQGQCIEANWKHDASIEKILAKAWEGESKVVASFNEAIIGKECYVIRYDGYIEPKVSGTYVFGATKVDNGFYLNIDGTVAYEFWAGSVWNDKGGNTYPTGIELEAGVKYPFTADFLETNGGEGLELVASIDGGEAASINELFNFYTEIDEGTGDEGTGNEGTGDEGTGDEGTGDEGNNNEEVVSNTALSATDKKVLFYTDFSDLSDLVVKVEGPDEQGWVNFEADETVTPTLDAEGNLVLTADQYIDLGADLLKGQDEIIIEFVVKPDKIVNHAAFAGIGANLPYINEGDWWVIGTRDDGAVKFGALSNGKEIGAGDSGKTEGGLLKVGEWVNVKYEVTATTVKVFVNGVEKKSWDVTGTKTVGELAEIENAEFIFGKEMRFGDAGFSGTVSEIRVTTTKKADSSTGSAGTGDVASVAAILLAGAAALGGLKLRKKSK